MGRNTSHNHGQSEETLAPTQRLDTWIWFARFCRQRESASDLIKGGHVRVNGVRVCKPGHAIRVGSVLTLALPGRTLLVRIVALPKQRSNAQIARLLYDLADEIGQF